jgi:hypothetical protein
MEASYLSVVEPIWDLVSIYDGGDVFLEQLSKVTEKQKVLFCAHWAQSEIMNGGLGQFFSNPTGVLAPEAVEAFSILGMPKCANAIRNAMIFFGENYPRERRIREDKFEAFYRAFGKDAIPLREYEDIVAVEIEEENRGFWEAADEFAKQN